MRLRSALPDLRLVPSFLCLSSLLLFACAEAHSPEELIARAGPRPHGNDGFEDPIVDPPFMGPIDAGRPKPPVDLPIDAGRPRPPVDARVPSFDATVIDAGSDAGDSGLRDSGLRDASLDAGDANLPPWQTSDASALDVNVVATCDSPAPTDGGAPASGDAGCRDASWHKPPCYRAPADCPAIRESTYCTGFASNGDLLLVGLDHGTTCRIGHDPKYPSGPGSNAFALIGADIYSIEGDVILKRSITDGSFDVAPVQAWTVFGIGDALGTVTADGSIQRFANWQALKSGAAGEMLAKATPGANPVFGANRNAIAAAWPDGSLYLLTIGDARQRTRRLVGYNSADTGTIRGLDLAEDGRVIVATDHGITTYNSEDGRAVARLNAPPLSGLVCEPGLAAGATPPVIAGSARPGYYPPNNDNYVIASSDCQGAFNGPRYTAEKAGPELFMIGNFFTQPNTIRDDRSTPHVLVLTTIEPTQWNVTVSANAKLERILLNGSTSTIVLQSPSTVPIDTFFDGRSLGQWGGEWPALEESQFRASVESQTMRSITESFGCHFGSSYVLRDLPPMCMTP
jgi:hypothetical protein